jgi:hypothetical protein
MTTARTTVVTRLHAALHVVKADTDGQAEEDDSDEYGDTNLNEFAAKDLTAVSKVLGHSDLRRI